MTDDAGMLFAVETTALRHDEVEPARIPTDVVTTPLMCYQARAIGWMRARETTKGGDCRGGLLMDDAGLGKTLTVLALMALHPTARCGLIVVPAHLVTVWRDQWEAHVAPATRRSLPAVFLAKGLAQSGALEKIRVAASYPGMVVMSYGALASLWRERNGRGKFLFADRWGRIVLDEGHVIRNPSTAVSQAARSLRGKRRWLVTATPVVNGLRDLFAAVSFLRITPFATDRDDWNAFLRHSRFEDMRPLREMLARIGIRRGKEVLSLPPAWVETVSLPMDDDQRSLYEALYAYSRARAERLVARLAREAPTGRSVGRCMAAVLTQILRLKQAASSPLLALGHMPRLRPLLASRGDASESVVARAAEALAALADVESPTECPVCLDDEARVLLRPCGHGCCARCWRRSARNGREAATCGVCGAPVEAIDGCADEAVAPLPASGDPSSNKIRALIDAVRSAPASEKFVVVSQWRSFLDIVRAALASEFPAMETIEVTGRVTPTDRHALVRRFQQDPVVRCALITLGAGGEGITLTAAQHLWLMDRWWNAAREHQASNRVHRIGQRNGVRVVMLQSEGTIENQIDSVVASKQMISDALLCGRRVLDCSQWFANVRICFDLPEPSGPAEEDTPSSNDSASIRGHLQ